ncbi:MAG: hypothetical protein JO007_07135 [Alphaproteobacteria bacterium]|nr:hypothetical protein [Alphaproteobacteria bacterium]
MADREQRGMEQKPERDFTGMVGQSHGSDLPKEQQGIGKPGGTVGREVPDESKEHHTEIAVEAGHGDGEHSGQGDRPKSQQSGGKPGGTVGREVPDESKEHHTEIAVEAGHRDDEHRGDKR